MKAVVEAHKLSAALGGFRALIRKHQIPIIECVRIAAVRDRLTISGTDLNREMALEVSAEVAEEGSVVVRYDRLLRYAGATPNGAEVSFAGDAAKTTVRAGRSSCALPGLPAEDWPSLTPPEDGTSFEVDVDELKRVVAFCEDAVEKSGARPYLEGIFFAADGQAVATDGHAMAVCAIAAKVEALLPIDLLTFVAGTAKGQVAFSITDLKTECTWDGGRIISKMIDGTFPQNWRVVCGRQVHEAKLDLGNLLAAFKRVLAAVDDPDVGIAIKGGLLSMRSRNPDSDIEGTDAVECEAESEIVFGISADLAIPALTALEARSNGGALRLSWIDAGGPLRFKIDGDDTAYRIIMPLRPRVTPEVGP